MNGTTFLGVVLVISALPATAQSDHPEPDLGGIFYRLDAGKLVPLERQSTATMHGKAGFNVKVSAELQGGKSPVRFRAGERLDFVVRSPAGLSVDPATYYALRTVTPKKKQRELLMMATHASPFGGATTKTGAALDNLPLEFARYGVASLRMATPGLPPGEYALTQIGGQTAFCFGAD